jgi:glycogen debranching enzyme
MIASGHQAAGTRLATGILEAAHHFGGRPPELFAGFGRDEFPQPVPYPTSCSPQAWAAGSTIMLVQAMLGLTPDVPNGLVSLAPCLPDGVTLQLDRIPVGDGELSVRVNGRVIAHCESTGTVALADRKIKV